MSTIATCAPSFAIARAIPFPMPEALPVTIATLSFNLISYHLPFLMLNLCDYKITEFLPRSEEHTSELQSRFDLVCRLLLEKKKLLKSEKHLHDSTRIL